MIFCRFFEGPDKPREMVVGRYDRTLLPPPNRKSGPETRLYEKMIFSQHIIVLGGVLKQSFLMNKGRMLTLAIFPECLKLHRATEDVLERVSLHFKYPEFEDAEQFSIYSNVWIGTLIDQINGYHRVIYSKVDYDDPFTGPLWMWKVKLNFLMEDLNRNIRRGGIVSWSFIRSLECLKEFLLQQQQQQQQQQ